MGVDESLHWSGGPTAAHNRGESLSLDEIIASGGIPEGVAEGEAATPRGH